MKPKASPPERLSNAQRSKLPVLQCLGPAADQCKRLAIAVTFLLPLIALALQPAVAAEADFLVAHTRAVAANPNGFSVTVELVGKQTRFRVGELIPLNLVYKFDDSTIYCINDGLAQGSGTARLLEVFRISPQSGTRRQTADEPNFHRWAGGTPIEPRANRIYRYRVYLNEWRRSDTPGKYQLYGVSARICGQTFGQTATMISGPPRTCFRWRSRQPPTHGGTKHFARP